MRFSVIVPVYNTVDYLPACVRSVQAQRFKDWELVLVDDGSTDGSGPLCDELAARDARIRVVHQANGGLACARNTGIRAAAGDTVLFLDSDDFYPDPEMLALLAPLCERNAVVCYDYARFTREDTLQPAVIGLHDPLPAEPGAVAALLVQRRAYTSSACMKAVRRAILADNALFFEDGRLSEDILWSARLLCLAGSVTYLDRVFYAYRMRPGSITNSISEKHLRDLCHAVEGLQRMQTQAPPPMQAAFNGYMGFQYATLMINLRLCREPVPKELYAAIKGFSPLLRYDLCPQVRMLRAARSVLGFAAASHLVALWFRMNNG